MLRGFFGNLIFAIIARMLCGNHLNWLTYIQMFTLDFDSPFSTIEFKSFSYFVIDTIIGNFMLHNSVVVVLVISNQRCVT